MQAEIKKNHISDYEQKGTVCSSDRHWNHKKSVAIVGKKNENGKIEILGISKAPSTGVRRGVVQNIEETVNAIQATVDDSRNYQALCFLMYLLVLRVST